MAKPLFGLLADFADADALLAATRAAHQAGYRHMEAFSPFPLEAIEPLLGLDHREPIRWGVAGALVGALAGFAVSAWQADSALPLTATLAACACLSWLSGRVAQMHTR